MTIAIEEHPNLSILSGKPTNVNPVDFHIVGDAFVDLFCFLGGKWPEQGGDAQLSHPIDLFAGGSGVNTTTHFNSLMKYFQTQGATLSLHTALNPGDPHGQTLLAHAKKHGFLLLNCKPDDDMAATGHCVAIVSGQDRSFMTYRGCVDTFRADHINTELMLRSESHVHMHIAGFYNLSGFQHGQIKKQIEYIRAYRQENSKTTTVSLVPQHDASKEWDSGIDELLPCLDFLIMNDMEAMYIVTKSRLRRGIRTANEGIPSSCTDEHIQDFASFFGIVSPRTCVVITRGASGAVVLRDGTIVANQSAFKVKPLDPTGAGDSFAAGFMYGLGLSGCWGHDKLPSECLEKALMWGCALGTASVRMRGASLPSTKANIEHYYTETAKLNAN